jgi:hypothetical protein
MVTGNSVNHVYRQNSNIDKPEARDEGFLGTAVARTIRRTVMHEKQWYVRKRNLFII